MGSARLITRTKTTRAGNSVTAIAEMEGLHRDTVTAMTREAALRYLAQCEANARTGELEGHAFDVG